MKSSILSLLAASIFSTVLLTGCASHSEALKTLPGELAIADDCRNTNKNFEHDCYDLIAYKNTFAQLRLGIQAQKNEKYEEAYHRYTLAQKNGNFYANALLADMYNRGLFVPQSKDKVIDLLEDVKDVDPIAAYKLAFLYISDESYKKAINLLEFAAQNDVKDAQLELYKIYDEGSITKMDLDKSNFWKTAYDNNETSFMNKIYGL